MATLHLARVALVIFCWEAVATAQVTKHMVLYYKYPILVDLDETRQMAMVSPPDIAGFGKSRTFYDYNTKMIAYKANSQCYLERMKDSEGGLKHRLRQFQLKGQSSKMRDNPRTMYVSNNNLSKYEVWRLAGSRISGFCRGFPAVLLQELRPQFRNGVVNNELPDLEDIREPDPQIGDNFLEQAKGRTKRQTSYTTSGYGRRYRGQTQSQYLAFQNGGKDGKAEADSSPEISRTHVSGTNGMGQAQSQSGQGNGCEGCYPVGYGIQPGYVPGTPPADYQQGVRQPGEGVPGVGIPGYVPGTPPADYQQGVRQPGAPSVIIPGLGAPGVGRPGEGAPGVGLPGVGAPGVGVPGVGAPGVGAQGIYQPSGVGIPSQQEIYQPGISGGYPGIRPSGVPGVGAPGTPPSGVGIPSQGIYHPGIPGGYPVIAPGGVPGVGAPGTPPSGVGIPSQQGIYQPGIPGGYPGITPGVGVPGTPPSGVGIPSQPGIYHPSYPGLTPGGVPGVGAPGTPSSGVGIPSQQGIYQPGIPGGYPGITPSGVPGGFPGVGGVPGVGLPGGVPGVGVPGGVPDVGVPGGVPGVGVPGGFPGVGAPGGVPVVGVPSVGVPGGFPGVGAPGGVPGVGVPGVGVPGGFPGVGAPGGVPGGFPGVGAPGGVPGVGVPGGFPGVGAPGGVPGVGVPGGFPGVGAPGGVPGVGVPGVGVSGGLPGVGAPGGVPGAGVPGGFPGVGVPGGVPGVGVPGGIAYQPGYYLQPGTGTPTQVGYPGGIYQQFGGGTQPGYPQVGSLYTDQAVGYTAAGDSQAESNVRQEEKDTRATSSAQGKYGGGTAQTQVSGIYSGSGAFSAQAQTSDKDRGAQSQVVGGKEGATSTAQGQAGSGKSQSQVQLGSSSGATTAEAQSGGYYYGTNTQVQAGSQGGMADAQAKGQGSTTSQAQIGFTPYQKNGKANGQKSPFYGGGTASAQSGAYSGQSQSQIQGSFRHGISYTGGAQAGSGQTTGYSRNSQTAAGGNRQQGQLSQHGLARNSRTTSSSYENFGGKLGLVQSGSTNIIPHNVGGSISNGHQSEYQPLGSLNNNPSSSHTFRQQESHEGGSTGQESASIPGHIDQTRDYDDYETTTSPDTYTNTEIGSQHGQPSNLGVMTNGNGRVQGGYRFQTHDARRNDTGHRGVPTQTQHIFLGPLNGHGAHVIQDSDNQDQYSPGDVLQPGQTIHGTPEYTIPKGYRGRITSVAGPGKTATQGGQAQTVILTPGAGNITYTNPSAGSYQPPVMSIPVGHQSLDESYDQSGQSGHVSSENTHLRNGDQQSSSMRRNGAHLNQRNGRTSKNGNHIRNGQSLNTYHHPTPDSFVTVTKSVTGQLGNGKASNGTGKYTHTYYTKSSTCGYFTFSCNVVFGSNGRTKICKPNPPTNPDGTPCCC